MDQNQNQHRGPSQTKGKNQMMGPNQTAATSTYPSDQEQQPYIKSAQYIYQLQQQELQQQLNNFWANQSKEIQDTTNFRTHNLPLARIKKIMKSDQDVHMISAEAPILFAKACELFIMDLTMRAWANTEENKRRTLQKHDIASAISTTDVFDFLVDVVPRDDSLEQKMFGGIPMIESAPVKNVSPYYYGPPQYVSGPSWYDAVPRIIIGRPISENVAGPSWYGAVPRIVMGRPISENVAGPSSYGAVPRIVMERYISENVTGPSYGQQAHPPNSDGMGEDTEEGIVFNR